MFKWGHTGIYIDMYVCVCVYVRVRDPLIYNMGDPAYPNPPSFKCSHRKPFFSFWVDTFGCCGLLLSPPRKPFSTRVCLTIFLTSQRLNLSERNAKVGCALPLSRERRGRERRGEGRRHGRFYTVGSQIPIK